MEDLRQWLLLLHQIPPKPAYFRAKVLRCLSQLGALPVKNSAYILPDSDDAREDLEWLRQEIEEQGGTAWLFRADVLAGMSVEQIEEAFRQLLSPEYEGLIEQARELLQQADASADGASAYRKLLKRSQELKRVDFYDNPLRQQLEGLVEKINHRLLSVKPSTDSTAEVQHGRRWVTRKGIHVDRIASAWLIRRFIDPNAEFVFVDAASHSHQPGELRFDMFGGEFTHRGDSCTFEVLLSSHDLQNDAALVAIGEIVHDIDVKDSKYQREETAGVARLVDGLCSQTPEDNFRIERGHLIFESLYRSFT
jgi:hypothetical protein